MAQEKTFENKVKNFLNDHGAWYVKYWGGGQFTKSGIPDIIVCHRGKFIAIEVKAPKGKPTLLQINSLKEIEDAGGYGILLYPDHFKVFENFILCLEANDPNAFFNYKLMKLRRDEWERKLNE